MAVIFNFQRRSEVSALELAETMKVGFQQTKA